MDVDNDPIDPNLLLQFTCLNTTDRDDLVKQFTELIGEVNNCTAEFYLEMNNWNLQNAICSYLDFTSPISNYSMTVVQQFSPCQDVTPNAGFGAVVTIRNDGRETWPRGCYLKCWYGTFACEKRFPVDPLEPNCETSVFLTFTAPSEPGSYQSSFRLTTPWDISFGNALPVSFQVLVKLEDTEEQRLSDDLAARMALIDNAESKVMEEESNTSQLFNVITNPVNHTIGSDQRNVFDFNQSDHSSL